MNGMECTVLGYNAKVKSIDVRTDTGYRIMVWPYTDPDHKITFLPVRPGYADTIIKFQGAELPHVTGLLGCAWHSWSSVHRFVSGELWQGCPHWWGGLC